MGKLELQSPKSGKQTGDKTFGFTLHDDIKFDSRNKFDAGDLVFTLNWVSASKIKIRCNWWERAVILGLYRIRYICWKLNSQDLLFSAYRPLRRTMIGSIV